MSSELQRLRNYGRLLGPSCIGAAEVGQVLRKSPSALYREGRFLGGCEHRVGDAHYVDANEGDLCAFTGRKWISRAGAKVYELVYHGGLIRD
jgi:hypothetical protein